MDNQNNTAPVAPQNAPSNKTLMGVFAYLGPLVIVSYIVAKDDLFVKYHVKQGLVLFVIEAVVWLLNSMMPALGMLLNIVSIAVLVFAIIGIVNVSRGVEKELPFIGKYSKFFPI